MDWSGKGETGRVPRSPCSLRRAPGRSGEVHGPGRPRRAGRAGVRTWSEHPVPEAGPAAASGREGRRLWGLAGSLDSRRRSLSQWSLGGPLGALCSGPWCAQPAGSGYAMPAPSQASGGQWLAAALKWGPEDLGMKPTGPAGQDDPGQAAALPPSLEASRRPLQLLSAQTSCALPSLPAPRLCLRLAACAPPPPVCSPTRTPGVQPHPEPRRSCGCARPLSLLRALCWGLHGALAPLTRRCTVPRAGHAAGAQRALCWVTWFPAPTILDTT